MSKLATILGVFLGMLVLMAGMFDFDRLGFITAFFDWQSLLVVLGGTLAATLVNYPLGRLRCVLRAFWIIFSRETLWQEEIIAELLDLALVAQRKGKLALEPYIEQSRHHFLRVALSELMSNSANADILRRNLENELNSMRLRHAACQEIFHNMASYAPAFGMLGTVMGLIIMMTGQSQESAVAVYGASQSQDMLGRLLSGMGLALVTTFYGVALANLVFLPVAGKLRSLSDSEMHANEIILQGVMGLQREDSPLRLKDELLTFVSRQIRDEVEQQRQSSRGSGS